MQPYSVIFCGTPAFAVPSLEKLAADPAFDVKLVISQPDKPAGRSQRVTVPPVKASALKIGFPIIQPDNINNPAVLDQISLIGCDFLVVVAYGKILSKEMLALPRIAAINVHGSVLPRWRGASPVEHSILAGDTESGVTVQIMAEELDAGPILGAEKTAVGSRETAPELKERLCHLGADLLVRMLKAPLHPVPQPMEGITFCRKLTRKDGIATPASMTAETIDCMVRALVPWPGVTCNVRGQEIKLIETALEPVQDSVHLPCAQSTTLHLVTVQAPGKKEMRAADWARGLPQ